MSLSDNVIVDKADEWKKKEFALKEEAIRLRHKRLSAIGKFIKWIIIAIAGLSALGGTGFGIYLQCQSCNEQSASKEAILQKEKEERDKARKEKLEFYESAWVKCAEKLSINECKVIRELSYERGWDDGYEQKNKDRHSR